MLDQLFSFLLDHQVLISALALVFGALAPILSIILKASQREQEKIKPLKITVEIGGESTTIESKDLEDAQKAFKRILEKNASGMSKNASLV